MRALSPAEQTRALEEIKAAADAFEATIRAIGERHGYADPAGARRFFASVFVGMAESAGLTRAEMVKEIDDTAKAAALARTLFGA